MKKKNSKRVSLLPLFVFVLFANLFFYHSFGSVALWALMAGLWILLIKTFDDGRDETKQVKWLGSGVLTISMLTYLMVSSGEKVTTLIVLSLIVMLISVYSWLKQGEIGGILEMGLSGVVVVREYLRSGWQIVKGIMNGSLGKLISFEQTKKQKSPWVKSIAVGMIVGLPIVAWLTMTLASADPVFAEFARNLMSEEFLGMLPGRLVWSALLFVSLAPILIMKWRGYKSPLGWIVRAKWGREMTVVTAMLVLVLGMFLVVQWPYVFVTVARETDLSQFGVATYSEYVKRGFGYLLKVVGMVFGVSWVSYLLNKNQKGGEKKLLLWVQGLLGIEFGVFVISIFRRVWLYQSYHGLTLARLYGLALLVGIVGMMVTMALRYLYPRVRWVRVEMAWILLVVFGAIWMKMESWIVKYPPTVNQRVDYTYLARLSSDGQEGWLMAYDWAEEVLRSNIENEELIGRDERRDVFYAGIITKQLTRSYHKLIMQYGSEEEVNEYIRSVIEYKLSVDEDEEEMVQEELRRRLEDLDKDDWSEQVDVNVVSNSRNNWSGKTYLSVSSGKERERLDGWDRKLAWDWSRNQVYKWMSEEIGFKQLIELQRAELELRRRILFQPENEQEFDIDISLESPFLR